MLFKLFEIIVNFVFIKFVECMMFSRKVKVEVYVFFLLVFVCLI